MVRTLVLVRHGTPESSSASGSDFDRRLTPSGARALETAYPRTFALLGDDAEVTIWSSPAIRALETADAVARATDAEGIEPHDSLYAQDAPAFFAELASADADTLVAVGHAPFMDIVASRILGSAPSFGKGAAAAIALAEGSVEEGSLLWFVAGPKTRSWEELASVEREVAAAADDLTACVDAFVSSPEDVEALRTFRVALRRVRSLLQFVEPWQSKKQNRRSERVLKDLQAASAHLREIDILSQAVDALVEDGELGDNTLLPMACAKERALECSSLLTLMRKGHASKALDRLASDLSNVSWKSKVLERGLTVDDFCARFDEMLNELDDDLFGLDLRDGSAVYAARRDAKEMHYVAERLGTVLGPDRAVMSEYMDEIQAELGALSDARGNRKLANEFSKSPRFRGVRADLGVVARDQAEVVSAITSGLERSAASARPEGKAKKK